MLDKSFWEQLDKDVAIMCEFYKQLHRDLARRQAYASLKNIKKSPPKAKDSRNLSALEKVG